MLSGAQGEAIANRYFRQEPYETAFPVHTGEWKAVAAYTGLSFAEIAALSYPLYLLYRRDALLYGLRQSESGRQALQALWRLSQTRADLSAVRRVREE